MFDKNASASDFPKFDQWKQTHFSGKNRFEFFSLDNNNEIKVVSNDSASGLFLEQKIDLKKTPLLSWSWKISNVMTGIDEGTKQGDDFAARVYVVVSTGPLPWQKLSLTYVWSSHQAIGSIWSSPYTSKVKILSLNTGVNNLGNWQHHTRNIQEDLLRAFGKTYNKIDAIAIMTDTDNSKQKATAWYKNLRLDTVANH